MKAGEIPLLAYAVLALFLIGAAIAITTYIIRFVPYREIIEKRIEEADPAHRRIPNHIIDLTLLNEDRNRIRHHVAVRLERSLDLHDIPYFFWQIQRRTWELALLIHFKPDEIYTLWCESLRLDGTKGFNNIARKKYQRNIDELSYVAAARIIIESRIPSYFIDRRSELDEQAHSLVAQYESQELRR